MFPSQPRCWYLAKNKQVLGPFFFEQLRQLVRAAMIDPSDLIRADGGQQWQKVISLADLFPGSDEPVAAEPAVVVANARPVLVIAEAEVVDEAVLDNEEVFAAEPVAFEAVAVDHSGAELEIDLGPPWDEDSEFAFSSEESDETVLSSNEHEPAWDEYDFELDLPEE